MRHLVESKQIVLSGQARSYSLKRSRNRRTLALSLYASGLVVHAPHALPLTQIEAFIQTKSAWVTQKLALQAERVRSIEREGLVVSLEGRRLACVCDSQRVDIALDGALLLVPQMDAMALRTSLQRWLKQQAQRCYAERLQYFRPRLLRQPTALKLSSARTRWGSCTAAGVVRVNWRLVQASAAEIDYVLAHELAHLVHLDHSPKFWREVARLCPDFEVARARLRAQGYRYQAISDESLNPFIEPVGL